MTSPLDAARLDGSGGAVVVKQALVLGLSRLRPILLRLGSPETSFSVVHVAGTNGKGSVCALVEAALRVGAALRTGLFVSPFLREPRDAVRICGSIVSEGDWNAALREVLAAAAAESSGSVESSFLTPFEIWTSVALLLFARARVDVAVIEVGVGGSGDATNVVPPPEVALIAPIALDHMELLGPTIADIAAHKAGILKRGGGSAAMAPGMHTEAAAVVRAAASSAGVPITEAEPLRWHSRGVAEQASTGLRLPLPLAGDFQLQNAALALAGLQALRSRWPVLDDAAIARGFAAVVWPGRMQRLRLQLPGVRLPLDVLADGGHNEAALAAVRAAFDAALAADAAAPGFTLIYGCTASRPLEANLRTLLRSGDELLAVPFATPEGMPWVRPHAVADVAEVALRCGAAAASACASLDDALQRCARERDAALARGEAARLIAVCGSLYLVADLFRGHVPADEAGGLGGGGTNTG